MGKISVQIAIYLSLLLVFMTFTIIAPFYPQIAKDKGLDLWLIGLVFAMVPIGSLATTPFLGKYLYIIGRKNIVVASYVFIGASLILLSPIEHCDMTVVIILSLTSRFLAGIAVSCITTTVTTIFVSDFPDEIETMISRMQAAMGVGLGLGPIIGIALEYIDLLLALATTGGAILSLCPAVWFMLGQFREYRIKVINIERLPLLFKPVMYIQRIIFPLIMQLLVLFFCAMMALLLELHLISFGLDNLFISLAFTLESVVYLTATLTTATILKGFDERVLMVIGSMGMTIAYILMAPWGIIFPDNLEIVIISLPIFAVGKALAFSNFYIVFSFPFMINSASEWYGYEHDDILTDVISSFAVFFQGSGELLGSLYGGFISDWLGIRNSLTLAGWMNLLFGIMFIFGTGMIGEVCCKRNRKSL